tara:strand:- start:4892 stop:5809 length:918 start_codon:yes stop_codon:yes gene_type:complete
MINNSSGFVLNTGEVSIRRAIEQSELPYQAIHFLSPQDLTEKLSRMRPCDQTVPLIGGGDGTIRSCAMALMDKDIPFGILPMGTMNLLAHDLGLSTNLEDALSAYARPHTQTLTIDVGMVNNQCFLCCAGLGIMPKASRYREKLRKNNDLSLYPKLTAFILEHMNPDHFKSLVIEIPPSKRIRMRTASLVVSNNQFTEQTAPGESRFKKATLQDGQMAIYALKSKGWLEKLIFFSKLGLGGWKSDPLIEEWTCREAIIKAKDDTVLVSLDGEPTEMRTPLKFEIKRLRLKLLIPGTSLENTEACT